MDHILRVLTRNAVEISDSNNIGITALRDGVESLGTPGFGTTSEAGSLSGGSSESGGEEESGNGEELHLDRWRIRRGEV